MAVGKILRLIIAAILLEIILSDFGSVLKLV